MPDPTAPAGADDLRDRYAEALTREHYRRANARIEASPEEHQAAMADAVMAVRDAELERLRAELERRTESRSFWRKFAAKLEAERDDARDERDAERQHAEQVEAERVQAIAAVRTAWTTHIRDTHPTRMQDPACAVCQVLVPLSRDLPRKHDSREEIEARLAVLDTPGTATTCPRCEGSRFEPGTEAEGDWDSAAMRHHPPTGEPCTACNGTGTATDSEGDGS